MPTSLVNNVKNYKIWHVLPLFTLLYLPNEVGSQGILFHICIQWQLKKTSSPKGNDRSPESNVPRSICPKTLCSLSSTPMMLHIKFDQDWPTGLEIFKFKSVKFLHSRASNSKMSRLIRPKIELQWAFMPVLVISNFDDDSIKNEQASMETPFSHYKSMGIFSDAQGQLTP